MACRTKVHLIFSNCSKESSHFFKVILPRTLAEKKLRIPRKFVMRFGNELSVIAKLKVPDGRVWQVGLTKDGSNIWLQFGWYEFAKYYSVGAYYCLVFNYVRSSTFEVLIFDKSTCEICYSYYDEKPREDDQNSAHQDKLGNMPQSTLKKSKLKHNFEPESKRSKTEERAATNASTSKGTKCAP